MRKIILGVMAALILASGTLAFAAGGDRSVMLQGFCWTSWKTAPWWNVVRKEAEDISKTGFNIVWLPPSGDAASNEGYMPRRLYIQDSGYGTADQLKSVIKTLHAGGVKVLADLVLNHRVGYKDWADFADPPWGPETITSDDEWGKGTGARDTGLPVAFARDLDHASAVVRTGFIEWMKWLRSDIGYDGWRYDFARGYAPAYVLEYNRANPPAFAVTEIWDDLDLKNPDAHRRALASWLDSVNGEVKVFDFTTKGLLQQAVGEEEYWRLSDSNGNPSGLMGIRPASAVTFVDNHDTVPRADGYKGWPFPPEKLMQGYAYILTHPGVPCVFWPDFFDPVRKVAITSLMKIRRSSGIDSVSAVSIVKAEKGLYAAIVDGKLAVRLGTKALWEPGKGWISAAAGPGYNIWIKSNNAVQGR
ncbi:MAG: alpha-amylase C-terminal beta-sheet domain-containing protein [Elusimicrobiota bacterium]